MIFIKLDIQTHLTKCSRFVLVVQMPCQELLWMPSNICIYIYIHIFKRTSYMYIYIYVLIATKVWSMNGCS